MSSELELLAAQMKGPTTISGTPQVDGPIRLGQVTRTVGLFDTPPTVEVGDRDVSRPMRVAGNIWHFNPGDTVVYVDRTGDPVVIGVLPVVGSESDPTDDDFVPWRLVGGAGEPAFQNSWVNYDTSVYEEAGFWMQSDGWVRLKGVIKDGSETANSVIFQLPSGWAPPFDCYFIVSTNNSAGLLKITTDRNVRVYGAIQNEYVSLNGITFPGSWIESTTLSDKTFMGRWEIPEFYGGWTTAIGDATSEIEFFHRHDGWVWTKGVISVQGVPGNAMALPGHVAPGYRGIILNALGFGVARHDVGGYLGDHNPRLWRAEAGGGAVETHIGGLNFFSSVTRSVLHEFPGTNVSFQNSWTNYGQDYQPCKFRKDHHGVVHVWGLAQGNASSADTIFTLPVGYRPAKRQIFTGMFNNTQGRTDVLADGQVLAVSHPNNTWHNLSGCISFRAMQ